MMPISFPNPDAKKDKTKTRSKTDENVRSEVPQRQQYYNDDATMVATINRDPIAQPH